MHHLIDHYHWYIPAGVIESIYWFVVIWVSHRFSRDLHQDIHKVKQEVYVSSDTTPWKGWVRIR